MMGIPVSTAASSKTRQSTANVSIGNQSERLKTGQSKLSEGSDS